MSTPQTLPSPWLGEVDEVSAWHLQHFLDHMEAHLAPSGHFHMSRNDIRNARFMLEKLQASRRRVRSRERTPSEAQPFSVQDAVSIPGRIVEKACESGGRQIVRVEFSGKGSDRFAMWFEAWQVQREKSAPENGSVIVPEATYAALRQVSEAAKAVRKHMKRPPYDGGLPGLTHADLCEALDDLDQARADSAIGRASNEAPPRTDEPRPGGGSRYTWNRTHECQVCGAKPGFLCAANCTREFGSLRTDGAQPTAAELLRRGGEWLGAARRWLQWHTRNGDQVTWGSGDLIEPQLSVRQIEDLAAEVAAAAMRPQPSEERLSRALKARWMAEAELARRRRESAPAESGDPPEGSRLWRCEKELRRARELLAKAETIIHDFVPQLGMATDRVERTRSVLVTLRDELCDRKPIADLGTAKDGAR